MSNRITNTASVPAGYVALYGNIAIPKDWCAACDRHALIRDGHFACCEAPAPEAPPPQRYKRESEPQNVRKLPPKRDRVAQLATQNHRCFYCDRAFGAIVTYPTGRIKILRLNWDHVVPFAYAQDNRTRNFVAACHVCNGFKHAWMFHTVEDAQLYLMQRWEQKLYSFDAPRIEAMRELRCAPMGAARPQAVSSATTRIPPKPGHVTIARTRIAPSVPDSRPIIPAVQSPCLACGTGFVMRRSWHRFCSTRCRYRNHMAGQVAAGIAAELAALGVTPPQKTLRVVRSA